MPTPEDYLAKAEEARAQLATAGSEAERKRLQRALSAYSKLATHGEEAAARAALKPPPRIRSEKEQAARGAPAPAPRFGLK